MKTFQNVNEILVFAMEQEQKAVEFYTQLAEMAKTDDMRKVFEDFAKEEISHKARLNQIQIDGIMTLTEEKVHDLKIADYTVSAEPTSGMTYEEALKLAMTKEKAAFKLYTALAERVENTDLRKIFQLLAIEESKHKLRFELEYDEHVLREN
jgi:rubrerythrin